MGIKGMSSMPILREDSVVYDILIYITNSHLKYYEQREPIFEQDNDHEP